MTTKNQNQEPGEIEALLPWHAAGALSRREAARVETALTQDAALARQFSVIREELDETIRLNETLGAPSPRCLERLMADIVTEEARSPARRASFNLGAWLSERLSAFSPRTLAWSAAAAVLAIVLQAGLLVGMYVSESSPGSYQTASYPSQEAAAEGSYALISFAPQATAAQITKFLETYKIALVDGPRVGGLYKVKVAVTGLPKEELARIVRQMQSESTVVRFAAPTE